MTTSFRQPNRDNYGCFLVIFLVFQVFCCFYAYGRLTDNWHFYSQLRGVQESENPGPNSAACVYGRVIPDPKPLGNNDQEKLEQILGSHGISSPIFVSAAFKYSVKRGKNTSTYTDRHISFQRRFSLKTPQATYHLPGKSAIMYSPREKKFSCSGGLEAFSRRATWVDVTYFAPTDLYLIGKTGPQPMSERTMAPLSPVQPLVFSTVSLATIRHSLLVAGGLEAAILIYFVLTVTFALRRSAKKAFVAKSDQYFIFDATGESEILAIVLLILCIPVGILLQFVGGTSHQFFFDIRNALMILGFFFLVHISKSVEFFYVANKKEGNVYVFSRGFFGQELRLIGPIKSLDPYIETVHGKKNSKTYIIKSRTKGIELTDSYNSPDELRDVLSEFAEFAKSPPLPPS